jgi:hypothetical protein
MISERCSSRTFKVDFSSISSREIIWYLALPHYPLKPSLDLFLSSIRWLVCSSCHELLILGISLRFNTVISLCLLHDRIRLAIGLLWTSDQPVAKTSAYTGQHNTNRNTKTNIHASSGIGTHDPSNQAAKTYALQTARPPGPSCLDYRRWKVFWWQFS